MEIQCTCGKFRAELAHFPRATPGRLKCYCDDCQSYLHHIGRADLLDENGGTEIIPAYPADIQIVAGKDQLKCVRLSPKGMYRFFTACCNTPIANTDTTRPWAGIHRCMYTAQGPAALESALGPVKSSIMGKFAKGTPPPGTPEKINFKGIRTVMPFILKGILFKKSQPSPFFEKGDPLCQVKVLTKEERMAALHQAGF